MGEKRHAGVIAWGHRAEEKGDFILWVVVGWGHTTRGGFVPSNLVFPIRLLIGESRGREGLGEGCIADQDSTRGGDSVRLKSSSPVRETIKFDQAKEGAGILRLALNDTKTKRKELGNAEAES